jgi:DNA segregation ATPase FtsK/SpoIIIE, S-DNA-T family
MVSGEKKQSAKGNSILPDVCGVVLFSLTFISLFALLSFSSLDLSVHAEGESKVQNWIGPGGALLADVFLTFFGLQAFLFPFLFLYLGIFCFWRRRFVQSQLHVYGLLAMFLSSSILLEELPSAKRIFSFPMGGALGRLLDAFLISYMARTGTVIIAVSLLILGLVMLTRLAIGAVAAKIFRKPVQGLLAFPKFLKKAFSFWPFVRFRKSPIRLLEVAESETKENPTKKMLPSVVPVAPIPLPEKVQIHALIVERDVLESKHAMEIAEKEARRKSFSFELPPLQLLNYDAPVPLPIDERVMHAQAERLEKTFAQFGIVGQVREIRPGPVVTLFEFVPAPGIKVSRIAALADDIAMAMTAVHVRIVAPIPGKGAVGIEIPNTKRETVYLKEIIAHPSFRKETHKLCIALGKTIDGKPYYLNLADMPHVLIAGTTGSGKSVSVNAMICSILYRATPYDVRFLMIDPKMLELSIYEGIPHLLLPPIIDSKKAEFALRWAVKEMDRRYFIMNELGVRDIYGYNDKVAANKDMEGHHVHMPFIVVIVDEYADLLAVAGREVEGYVMRLAQKARACGIHVMLATQRPSVDVITGVIKANFPVRMGFRLAASQDSKTIINRSGAEKLLGKGDMLMIPPGTSDLVRIHGAFVSEKELVHVIDFWKKQAKPAYDLSIIAPPLDAAASGEGQSEDEASCDERYEEAVSIVRRTQKCSTSWLQRQLGVGYNRAARMVERMEREGVVGPIQSAKGDREIFGGPNSNF